MLSANDTHFWHTIIIGAGASGLMCAGSFSAPKLILEHNSIPGRKLRITGGGKCNFTHQPLSERDYLSSHKHFAHNALAGFTPQHFCQLLQQAHIPYELRENGCFFAQNATDITQFLYQRALQQHTTFSFQTQVLQIQREKDSFCIYTSKGKFFAQHIVIACGGISYPNLGATGLAWQLAQQLGLRTIAPRPVLVGLKVPKLFRSLCAGLTGNSLPAILRTQGHAELGQLLFTHEGFSGPAVLQTSLYWQEKQAVEINFLPHVNVLEHLRAHKNEPLLFSKLLADFISTKISKGLLGTLDAKASDAPKNILVSAARQLNHFSFIPTGTYGYTHAEATAGGIDVSQIDPTTFQCRHIPGLFIIGEALDVTGRVGGFNLHWAWASAYAVAQALQNNFF